MNIIAKGGYCLVDMSGIRIDLTTYQTSQGIYDKIADAYNSAKPIILCGLADGSLDATGTGRAVSPVHAYIKAGRAVGGGTYYEVCLGHINFSVVSSDQNRVLVTNEIETVSNNLDSLEGSVNSLDERVTALEGAKEGA